MPICTRLRLKWSSTVACEAPTAGQAVTDEIFAPSLIDGRSQLHRHALRSWAFCLPAHARRKIGVGLAHTRFGSPERNSGRSRYECIGGESAATREQAG